MDVLGDDSSKQALAHSEVTKISALSQGHILLNEDQEPVKWKANDLIVSNDEKI